jgi:RimJ/RimL family protein N-acetyltransferase
MAAHSQAQGLDPEAAQAPIITRRLFLRAPAIADIPALTRLLADRRIAANTGGIPYPYAPIQGWRFVRHELAARAEGRDGAHFILTLRGNLRRIVGAAGFGWIQGCDPEIGYWIAAGERRRGFASEAAQAMLARVFLEGGAARAQAWVRPENHASLGVLRRAGFRRIGNGLRFSRSFHRRLPYIHLALRRDEWARRAGWRQNSGRQGESDVLL